VIRQQAALSDQLQAARALLLEQPRASKQRLRLAATIGIVLDALDALVAAHIELAALRAAPATATLMARIGVTLRAGSLDLQHLSLELLSNAAPSLPPDHSLAIDALKREAARLNESGELGAEALAAARPWCASPTRSAISGGWSGRFPTTKRRSPRSAPSISQPSRRARPSTSNCCLSISRRIRRCFASRPGSRWR
jgi:hypothetical protein